MRALLYTLARLIGDITAIMGGAKKVRRRVKRRIAGRILGSLLRRI